MREGEGKGFMGKHLDIMGMKMPLWAVVGAATVALGGTGYYYYEKKQGHPVTTH